MRQSHERATARPLLDAIQTEIRERLVARRRDRRALQALGDSLDPFLTPGRKAALTFSLRVHRQGVVHALRELRALGLGADELRPLLAERCEPAPACV